MSIVNKHCVILITITGEVHEIIRLIKVDYTSLQPRFFRDLVTDTGRLAQ